MSRYWLDQEMQVCDWVSWVSSALKVAHATGRDIADWLNRCVKVIKISLFYEFFLKLPLCCGSMIWAAPPSTTIIWRNALLLVKTVHFFCILLSIILVYVLINVLNVEKQLTTTVRLSIRYYRWPCWHLHSKLCTASHDQPFRFEPQPVVMGDSTGMEMKTKRISAAPAWK